MSRVSSLVSSINFFNHSNTSLVEDQVRVLTETLRPGDNIKVVHTPIVLPLGTSNEIGGYARSLGFTFGPKVIALNVERFLEEGPSMQKFILLRQIAQFDKDSRYLHIPMAALAVAVATLASTILFPGSLAAATAIAASVSLLGAVIISSRDQSNELDADKKAFSHLREVEQREVLHSMGERLSENSEGIVVSIVDFICKGIFNSDYKTAFSFYSGYPPLEERRYLLGLQYSICSMRQRASMMSTLASRGESTSPEGFARQILRGIRESSPSFTRNALQEEFAREVLQAIRESSFTTSENTERESNSTSQEEFAREVLQAIRELSFTTPENTER